MKKSSESEFIIKAEGNRNWWQQSIWTLLPAAAAIVLISWMRRSRPSGGGRKQSQQQGDDDHQKSPTTSIDSEEHGSPRWEKSSISIDYSGDYYGLSGKCSSLDNVVSGREEDRDDGLLLPEFEDLKCEFGEEEVRKLERFKIKPRNFMNVSTKKN
ncbi:hypothetical protein LINPERHAP1_LOCUS33507 [Linum perenne]